MHIHINRVLGTSLFVHQSNIILLDLDLLDLGLVDLDLLDLGSFPCLPDLLFGSRGWQSKIGCSGD